MIANIWRKLMDEDFGEEKLAERIDQPKVIIRDYNLNDFNLANC